MVNKKKFDFSGWATRNDIKCSDGRVIKKDAFKHNDGQTVPLVWNHNHKELENVLGHALLENRDEGVYAYGSFNETEQGKIAKEMVKHGDIAALSIYANKLKQKGSDVIHGAIREVSLVLAGANPGAYIETILAHSESEEEEARIFNPSEQLELSHSEELKTFEIVYLAHTGEKTTVSYEVESEEEAITKTIKDNNIPKNNIKSINGVELKHTKTEETKMPEPKEKTVQEVFDTLTEEQKNVVYALIGQALEENGGQQNEEDDKMKQNAFERQNGNENEENVLSHAEITEIITDAKRGSGSVKEAFLAHGIENVDYLFPEVQAVNKTPEMIQREMDWVKKVMSSVKHSPFSRIKSTAANITADAARAKGYVKGTQKVEEVISALKRTTTPVTVYKFQKMDRDDIIDITDFDVIAWLKSEMRLMLDEELARAILIGDGRLGDADDKINPLNIRPILGDSPTYTVPKVLTREAGDTDYTFAKKFIKDVIKARKDYKGSGNPALYTTEDMLTNMLLIEDTNGRAIYDTIDKLTTALRVSQVVTVPVMENLVRVDETETFDYTCLGILVNLVDYNVGADKGGAVNMFDDFDLNFNKYEYLIETRCSGALVKPFSAVSFELKSAHVAG